MDLNELIISEDLHVKRLQELVQESICEEQQTLFKVHQSQIELLLKVQSKIVQGFDQTRDPGAV